MTEQDIKKAELRRQEEREAVRRSDRRLILVVAVVLMLIGLAVISHLQGDLERERELARCQKELTMLKSERLRSEKSAPGYYTKDGWYVFETCGD